MIVGAEGGQNFVSALPGAQGDRTNTGLCRNTFDSELWFIGEFNDGRHGISSPGILYFVCLPGKFKNLVLV
jgi:hypothetical protein